MKRIRYYLRLILMFVRVGIQDDAAYRFDFLIRTIMAIADVLAELGTLWIIFYNTGSLRGWGPWEFLTLLGVYRIVVGGIGLFIAPNMRQAMEDIRQGTLDYVLLKPIDSQFLVSIRRIVLYRLSDILLGLGMCGYGVWKLGIGVSGEKVAVFLLMQACAVMIVYAIWLTIATSAFWFTRIANIEMVFWNIFEIARYPVDIYPAAVRWIFTVIIPVAFITSVPAKVCFGGPTGSVIASLVVAPLMLAAASWFWRFGVRSYSGASA